MILLIDNYDSFTYNLYHLICQHYDDIEVIRNDKIDCSGIKRLNPKAICISPGPCTPKEAGISVDAIKEFYQTLPILGICLGMQSLAYAFGGDITHAKELVHGKVHPIHHQSEGLFENLETPFKATRYHSLSVDKNTLPDCLKITAWTEDQEIMAINHKDYPLYGLQFHPESIETVYGVKMIENFIKNI